MLVKINNTRCQIRQGKYSNDRISLSAIEAATGEPYATLTVNLPQYNIDNNQTFIDINNCPTAIKDLMDADVISPPLGYAQSGFVQYPIVQILI